MKLNILCVLNKRKINSKGLAVLLCRLTYNKKRKVFSTGLFVNPELWNSKKQKIESEQKEHILLNTQLSLIKNNLNQAFLLLQINKQNFDVNDIYLQYKGENVKEDKTLLEVFEKHNERMLKLVGTSYTKSTYSKFVEAKTHTSNFIKHTYKRSDYLMSNLKLKFLSDFDYYLKTEKNQKQITINKTIQRLRKIIKLAISEEFITVAPFLLYRPKKVNNQIIYLTVSELKLLEKYSFKQKRLQLVKEMFIFCCYTGLAYQELSSLKTEHIVKGFDAIVYMAAAP